MNKIYQWAIERILSKPAPDRVPRTGDKAQDVDCYVMYIVGDDSCNMLAERIDNKGVHGKAWGAKGYTEETTITLEQVKNVKLEITHFYKTNNIQYFSLNDYLLKGVFPYYQLVIRTNKATQIFYNSKELARSERMETLRLILEKTIDDKSFSVTSLGLSSLLHTQRWYYHPDRERNSNYNNLLLESLVASGDLTKEDNVYKISSHAMVSLSQYEQDDRKHKETLRQSKAMSVLTFVLIIIGTLQVYIAFLKS